ncbi:DMT family transporter [Psychromonas hadalis]|uniref:DMT family transporter n=1 Tax=Psychromonas hadalis TaxID=211669 RepID=UPI0003B6C212|nr:DMT family transporter [Psychromonas hadalis]
MISSIKFNKISGLLAGLMVVVIWSGWIIISKWGLSRALTVWDITGIRFATAGLTVFAYALLSKFPLKSLFNVPIITCSLACGTFYVCAGLIGLQMSDAANTGVVINGTLPIMCATLLYFWNKTRLNISQYIGIVLILAANFLLFTSSGGATLAALLWLLLATLFMAFYSISMKMWKIELKQIMIAVPLINALFFTPIWYFLPSNIVNAPVYEIMLQVGYQGIVVSIIALFFMTYAITKLGAVSASTIMALVPIVSAFLATIFLQQEITFQVGLSIIVCSLGIACYSALQPLLFWMNRNKKGNSVATL